MSFYHYMLGKSALDLLLNTVLESLGTEAPRDSCTGGWP
jgi:hypothetical protein